MIQQEIRKVIRAGVICAVHIILALLKWKTDVDNIEWIRLDTLTMVIFNTCYDTSPALREVVANSIES